MEICRTFTPEQLLGPLNEVERKYAPRELFAAGDPDILKDGGRVSIVGSRQASKESLLRAAKLARILAEHGIVVVSGLARGIDTAAHQAAMAVGGKTIAVIGTPLDKVYPRENAALQAEIARRHLCISQFPSGYPTQPKNFPIRNRTMALISDATVIIEAGETSGSLSQGWEALRLGRTLFIAQWLIEAGGLKWPTKMLGHGARVLSDETLGDLLDDLPDRHESVVLDELAI
jgi:DNA processing protein